MARQEQGPEGGTQDVRAQGVQGPGNDVPQAQGQPGAGVVEMPAAFGALTERERAIFDAGMNYGAARMLHDMAEKQHAFVTALRLQTKGRQVHGAQMLENLPEDKTEAARLGEETGRRLRGAVDALIGRK